ncbi:hypothetical protein Pcinc_018779 [Petrolisthes cinctipes]|uniref:Uncharacterized protein n=1 Tax=Petrolisthes cinctipes TaxID=88211 RepID=A0AAE1FLH8_PETCI|nr:hypothetical protein Pcinc_018779 [Petrolisthes cinctipes]
MSLQYTFASPPHATAQTTTLPVLYAPPFNHDVHSWLPSIIHLHLQAQPNLTLHEYGKRADDLMPTYTDGAHVGPTQHTTVTIATPPTPTTGPSPLTHAKLQPPTQPPQPTPPPHQQQQGHAATPSSPCTS